VFFGKLSGCMIKGNIINVSEDGMPISGKGGGHSLK